MHTVEMNGAITIKVHGEVQTISAEDVAEMKRFAAENGRRWKSILNEMWMTGEDWNVPWARRIRNDIGGTALKKIRL